MAVITLEDRRRLRAAAQACRDAYSDYGVFLDLDTDSTVPVQELRAAQGRIEMAQRAFNRIRAEVFGSS